LAKVTGSESVLTGRGPPDHS